MKTSHGNVKIAKNDEFIDRFQNRIMIYKGLFWICSDDDTEHHYTLARVKCDLQGNFTDMTEAAVGATSKTKSNYKKIWMMLDKHITGNKPYNYYPRGRVEIKNGKAIIYANARIATEYLKNWAISAFNLTERNGIKSVALKADGSNHYKSYMEEDRDKSIYRRFKGNT